MTLMKWRIVSTLDDEADNDDGVRGERRAYRSCPFPRRRGGSLVLPKIDDNAAGDDPLEGYRQMDVLVSPVLMEDGASMLVVMRVARDDDNNDVDGSATWAYVAKISLAGRRTSWTRCGLIGTRARLSRFWKGWHASDWRLPMRRRTRERYVPGMMTTAARSS
jgi:hypothetical protein